MLVRPVRDRGDLRVFIDLPYRLYTDAPRWVPPLRTLVRQQLDRKRNPFFRHAEAEYFLAERDGRVVGRVSAHVDRNLQQFQQNRWGLFGWFECEDDQEAASALIEAASAWVRERGCDRVVGPMSFTTNDECGLLVAGFDRPPIVLTGWHHPYYGALLEGAGLGKAMDALMWDLWVQDRARVHPAIWEMAGKVESEHGIVCRHFVKKDLEAEVGRFLEVYNAAWERNWGFVPLSEDEVRAYAKELRPILDEHWAMIAEKPETGEVVGAALTLPDVNQVLARVRGGRLLPLGWLTLLRHRRAIDRVRVLALGVKREYQHTGVAARLYEMHYESAETTPQKGGETGWILETNTAMNKAMAGMGGTITRRYRFYERLLEDGAQSSAAPGGEFAGDWTHEVAGDGSVAKVEA
ncbi:GNAT family N-acetyltransferase [Patulibacter medicamentivorans]|uniref:GNAT family N-acetyltransferase n=1 Tax=Patulibacter medicamentivorans TaxID=1097667 RepID=UPI001FCC920D|nr:GNAT family N-acetyltransferase [Patulibacter medicamentivorans]